MAGRKSWRVSTLVRRALAANTEDSYWACVVELHLRGGEDTFQECLRLCVDRRISCKVLGANVLGQLGTPGRPFRAQSLAVLRSFLDPGASPELLNSALVAIGHLQEPEDSTGLRLYSSFAGHRSSNVAKEEIERQQAGVQRNLERLGGRLV